MARQHRNLDDWEAERGMTMGHTHPPVRHNAPEAGSLSADETVIVEAPCSATSRRDRQKNRPPSTLADARKSV